MANPAITIYLLFAVIHLTVGITVDILEPIYEVARGQSVTIRCTFKTTKQDYKRVVISWLAHPDNPEDSEVDILTYFYDIPASGPPTEELDVTELYTDRVTQQQDIAKGTADLTIKALTSNDNRKYDCKVKIPKDNTGKQSDTTSVVVLVPPSKPICNVQGTMELFHNINLTCRSEEGTPKPTYKWERRDFTDKLQPNPFKSTDVNGVYSLYNITTDIDGYYICTSQNKIDSASCNMTVAVKQSSMNIASTAGIIGACVAALLLLGIIIYCCCCRKKKDQSEEYELGMEDDVKYADKEPIPIEERKAKETENKPDKDEEHGDHQDNQRENYNSQGFPADRQYDYDDRRSDRHDDRRSDRHDDSRDRHDDSRERYDDRRRDYHDDSRDRYDDRRREYHDDSRDRYDDRRREYRDDSHDRYDDRRRDHIEDRFDERQDHYDHPDDRKRPPNLPTKKPPRA